MTPFTDTPRAVPAIARRQGRAPQPGRALRRRLCDLLPERHGRDPRQPAPGRQAPPEGRQGRRARHRRQGRRGQDSRESREGAGVPADALCSADWSGADGSPRRVSSSPSSSRCTPPRSSRSVSTMPRSRSSSTSRTRRAHTPARPRATSRSSSPSVGLALCVHVRVPEERFVFVLRCILLRSLSLGIRQACI